MLKIGLGYNIVTTNEISINGVRVDEKGKDGKEPFAKGRLYFLYSPNFYVLTVYLQENTAFTCYTNGMTVEDFARPVKSESNMFHIILKYVFKPEVRRIKIR